MKLRVRSLETKETIRIEIADSSSLIDLKTLIAGKLSSSSIPPQSISLSLNQKDEIIASSPSDSLQSLGLTSGDLLFYSKTQTLSPPPKAPNFEVGDGSISAPGDVKRRKEAPFAGKSPVETLIPVSNPEIPDSDAMEIEETEEKDTEIETSSKRKSFSVPCFLKRVMDLEEEERKGNLGYLVVAVHAAFLESGFVVCNEDGSRLPRNWNSAPTSVSIRYTLPELVVQPHERDVKAASLKFSMMSNQVSVYGNLIGERDVYRLHFDMSKVLPLFVCLSEIVNEEEGREEKEIFSFWKTVKDGLCLPLLIDICQKNGLPPPPCFARLPIDLTFKILELLPGVDVAKIGCSGSEMRYLTSNDELWKKKFREEFGLANERDLAVVSSWKEKFKRCWVRRKAVEKNQKDLQENRRSSTLRSILTRPPWIMPRHPPRNPYFGGDYDRFPLIGSFGPVGSGLRGLPVRRYLSPRCNLGDNDDHYMG